jgi:hypothetical protein
VNTASFIEYISHHGMARSEIIDGKGLQMWRVAVKILIKHSLTANQGWSSNWQGLGSGLITPE